MDEPATTPTGTAPKLPLEDETSVAEQLIDEGTMKKSRKQIAASGSRPLKKLSKLGLQHAMLAALVYFRFFAGA